MIIVARAGAALEVRSQSIPHNRYPLVAQEQTDDDGGQGVDPPQLVGTNKQTNEQTNKQGNVMCCDVL